MQADWLPGSKSDFDAAREVVVRLKKRERTASRSLIARRSTFQVGITNTTVGPAEIIGLQTEGIISKIRIGGNFRQKSIHQISQAQPRGARGGDHLRGAPRTTPGPAD